MKKIFSLLTICLTTISIAQTPFKPGCNLPFKEIRVIHTIDKTCPIQGSAIKINKEANLKQNKAKNNFCATGDAKQMKTQDFIDKHQKVIDAGISFGTAASVPLDRSELEKMGEGTLVYFIGYIKHAKYSGPKVGEAVNCKKKGDENADIHIDLIEKKNETDGCMRLTAEMSPHFRPESWNTDNLNEIADRQLKVKITGHLLFDASHGACTDGEDGYRASSWEIHPVYKIEVYVGKKWAPLNEWAQEEE